MPGRIVVAMVAELRVQGFLGSEESFAELLRILEKQGESVRGVARIRVAFVAEFARRIWLRGPVSTGRLEKKGESVRSTGSVVTM